MIDGLQKLKQLHLAVANTELIWRMVDLFYLQGIDCQYWIPMVQTIIYLYKLTTDLFSPPLPQYFRTKSEEPPSQKTL